MLLSGFTLTQTLAQSFPTALNEIWATTLENTGYSGFAFTAKRADNSASFNVSFVGKHADPTAASNFSGTTALVTTIYGQVNGLNATAMSGSAVQAFIDTDGFWSFCNLGSPLNNSPGLVVADNTLLKPTNPHLFMLMNPGPFLPGSGPPYAGQGLLVEYGGTGFFYNVGRYGFGIGMQNGLGFDACRNGSSPGAGFEGTYQNTIGEAHVDTWHVWDFSCSTLECRFDAGYAEINAAVASANITYGASQLNLMSDFDGNTPYFGAWRLIALYAATQSSTVRNQISNFLLNDGTTVTPLPTSFTDSDGFVYAPNYYPQGSFHPPDFFGLSCADEYGGYQWPSFGAATNLTNSASTNLVRLICKNNDNEIIAPGSQRSERGAYGNTIVPGQNAAMFAQFYIEPGSPMIGTGSNFAVIFQVHYLGGASPDICTLQVANASSSEIFQTVTNRNGGGNTAQGSSVPIVRGVWWAVLYRITWSAGGTTDSLQVYLGQNGNTLTEIVNVPSSSLFSTDSPTGAYPKQGIYTGDPGDNPDFTIRVANQQWSNTLSAFDAFITSQPALPTH